jgi:hypothetical protein
MGVTALTTHNVWIIAGLAFMASDATLATERFLDGDLSQSPAYAYRRLVALLRRAGADCDRVLTR